jgi:BMFP domain-containing protein YqiC
MNKVDIPQTPYYRDLHSKAILNTDVRGRDKYLMEREIALKEKAQKEATEKRVEKLENDISEIKQMLLDMRKV